MRNPLCRPSALAVLTAALALGAFACGGSGSPTAPGPSDSASPAAGSPGAGPSGTGTAAGAMGSLAVHITDSPFTDARALLVTFSEVSAHRADGDSWQTIPFAAGTSRTCDLKKLNGPTDVLGVGTLPTGKYTQVRLVVTSATLYLDNASAGASACAPSIAAPAGASAEVTIPSGVVKLNHEFTVSAGGSTMLLDFDGDKSVKQTGSGNGSSNGNGNGRGNGGSSAAANAKYMMTPVIRVVRVD